MGSWEISNTQPQTDPRFWASQGGGSALGAPGQQGQTPEWYARMREQQRLNEGWGQPQDTSRYQPGGGQMGGRPQGPPMGIQPQQPFQGGGYAPNQPPNRQRYQQYGGQMGGGGYGGQGGGGWGANNLGGQGGMQQQMMQNMLLNPNTQQPNRPGFGGGWGGGNR